MFKEEEIDEIDMAVTGTLSANMIYNSLLLVTNRNIFKHLQVL